MKKDKLFNVLVMGGILLSAPLTQADVDEEKEQSKIILEELLDSKPIPASLAFCAPDDENTCVENESGVKVPRAGITCCWGTSCEG